MTKDEALDLALEVLEENHHLIEEHERPEYLAHYDRVISAVSKARSAPVQEPVATIDSLEQEIYENTREFVSLNVMEWLLKRLNTTPPAQRQWVGLTETEVDECYESVMFNPDIEPTRVLVYQAIEAKLKEKNA